MSILFFSSKPFFLEMMGIVYRIPALNITVAGGVLGWALLREKMQLHISLLGDSIEEKGKL